MPGATGVVHEAGVPAHGEADFEEFALEMPSATSKRFRKPSLTEWQAYGETMTPVLPELEAISSYSHYESNGWKVGRATMKDWKAALRTCWAHWRKQSGKESVTASCEPSSNSIPPVSFDTAKTNSGQFGATPEIAEAWWLSRDKVGWLHKGQPITRWQSDLQGFANIWKAKKAEDARNGNGNPMRQPDSVNDRNLILPPPSR
jgi:hypothetical protein